MNSEDRDAVRFEHEAIILIENPYGSYYHGKMVNFSQTGMGFESNLPFKTDQTIIFGIENTPYESCPGVYRAIVKWCRRLPDPNAVYHYGIGVVYYHSHQTPLHTGIVKSRNSTGTGSVPDRDPISRSAGLQAADQPGADRALTNDRRMTRQPAGDFRKYQRKSVTKTVRLATRDETTEGLVTDISPGGIFLKVSQAYYVGQKLQLSIPLSHKKKVVKLLGEIVHINREGLGIKFKGLIK